MPTTLRDIANACGMDVSTVSRALRDDARVAASTRERIRRIATRMGYEPNYAARSLVGARTRTVWFLTPSITNPHEQRPADAASRLFAERGYDLLLMLYHRDAERYVHILRRLDQGVADGAVILPGPLADGKPELRRLADKEFPLVFLDRHPEFAEQPTVTTDNAGGAAMLVEEVAAAGAETFVVLHGDHNTVERDRRGGTVAALGRARMPFVFGGAAKPVDVAGAECVGIVGTLSHRICEYVDAHAEALAGKRLIYGCFDRFDADPYPAERAFICEQDFDAMALRAVEVVHGLIEGNRPRDAEVLVPPKGIRVIEGRR